MGEVRGFVRSLFTAFQGLIHVLRSERNARIHLLIAVLVLLLGVYLGISNAEMAAIFFAIIMVFISEVINTAIEKSLDLLHPEGSNDVRIIKDIAAGAVLVAAVGALAIGIAIFLPYIVELTWRQS